MHVFGAAGLPDEADLGHGGPAAGHFFQND